MGLAVGDLMVPSISPTTVVLGGGGLAGIGWLTGVLAALEESGGFRLTDAARVIGTSAGSATAAAILQSGSATTQFDTMVRRSRRSAELTPTADVVTTLTSFVEISTSTDSDDGKVARFVELSRSMAGVEPDARRAAIESRLTDDTWPSSLAVTAMRADGRRVVFTAADGVNLVDAITASCAVPGLWPAVTIGDATYVDGGVLSITNADLAEPNARTLVLAPVPEDPQNATPAVAAVLAAAGVITPSQRTVVGFGTDPFDPEVRGVAAVLGYEDGLDSLSRLT
ncbi:MULTISPECIES: patatin-like phospholipase family protein [unclassified Gordonia (in: high G+C Gram-positive bacteria)]